MRPDIAELLEGIQHAVRHEILPEVQSPWAKRQGQRVLWALEVVRQRALHEHAVELEANAQWRALLQEATAIDAGGDSAWGTAIAGAGAVLGRYPAREHEAPGALTAENAALRGAVDALLAAYPRQPDAAAQAFWKHAIAALQDEVAREDGLVDPK